MKIVQITVITLLLIIVGCKNNNTNSGDKQATITDNSNKTPDVNSLYQNYYQNPQTVDQIDENALIDHIIDNNLTPKRSITGLYYDIHIAGTGENIKQGDQLVIHYDGMFLDGKMFDSSNERGEPLEFQLSNRGLIQAWLEGLRYLKEGSEATFLVPSRLGYAKRGFGNMIGPDIPLKFKIKVIKVN